MSSKILIESASRVFTCSRREPNRLWMRPRLLHLMNPRVYSLEARIQKIKQQLTALGDLRPGNLTQQYNVCGKPDCRCKATPPLKHGPYYQLSFTWKGKSRSHFVRQPDVAAVKQQLRNYRRLRQLL